ncbi:MULTISPECIES: hypothetical protein [Rhodococcus]|uniref:Uncharacterized protein n=1 Tax=Rhodococcus oxybenzonivorans TaxID=1990687 RepID=A0AAE4V3Z1_9NOCA|nr:MULTISPECIES: hypothetical protein [Rhodococcus]MDV7243518.1 hypothetical protein [Rhodococcus oxybenzonivorans]MDV7268138.1 hypothetical protein [Rhodococcus oxybenzonivorans]MDV7277494.1 hypothetical protein [Rhodococcus oxybenzonivorans]MDV7335478.1 hypothetical protein [Rhodococcus oxybenzonivorans]MDV7347206.1 hypothetical protein [Rhodococcus oxybenzonivorans]
MGFNSKHEGSGVDLPRPDAGETASRVQDKNHHRLLRPLNGELPPSSRNSHADFAS